jgi:transposase-like protein
MKTNNTRPAIESLACVEPECKLYGLAGQGNLRVRKVYGQDANRYLRCKCCGREFSERKGTALWNTKVSEAKAVSVAAHLSEGCRQESIARLVAVDISVVQRLNRVVGQPGRRFHEERVQQIAVEALVADERYGFSATKQQAAGAAARGKKKFQPASPAMAAGLTDHLFSIRKLLLTPVYPGRAGDNLT